MKRAAAWTILSAFAVMACSRSATKNAEVEYNIVSAKGTLDEQCAQAQHVREAALSDHNANGYEQWGKRSAADCNRAVIYGGDLPADDQLRRKVERERDNELNSVADEAANSAGAAERARPRG